MADANPPLPPDANQSLQHIIGARQSNDDLHKIYLKSQQYCDDLFTSLQKNASETEQTLAKSEQSIQSLFSHMQSSAKKTATDVKQQFTQASKAVADETEKSTDRVIKSHQKHAAGLKDLTKGFGTLKDSSENAFDVLSKPTRAEELLMGISSGIKELLPGIVAFGSLALAVQKLVISFGHMSDEWAKFNQLAGGSTEYFNNFQKSILKISDQTNMSTDDLRELGMAFYGLGGNLSNSSRSLQEFLTIGGKAQNFFHMSNEEMSHLLREWEVMGESGKQVQAVLDNFYERAKASQMTMDEFNQSLSEGYDMWREFGALSGRTMNNFQYDLIGVKGLFKGLNIDVKNVGQSMQAMYGGGLVGHAKAAAFMSRFLGISYTQAQLEQYGSPIQAQQDLIKAGLLGMNQYTHGTMGMSMDELTKKFGPERALQVLQQRQMILPMVAQMANIPIGTLSQGVEGYQAARIKNPNLSIDDYLKQAAMTNAPKGKSLQEAQIDYMQSMSQLGKGLENHLQNFMDGWSTLALPYFSAGIKWLNSMHFFSDLDKNVLHGAATTTWHGVIHPDKVLAGWQHGILGQFIKKPSSALQALVKAAMQAGVPPALMLADALHESGLNPFAKGDYGRYEHGKFIPMKPGTPGGQYTSFGLFQLHKGGALGNMSPEQAFDPFTNASVQAAKWRKMMLQHPEADAGMLAYMVERPANKQAYIKAVNDLMNTAEKMLAELQKQTQIAGDDHTLNKTQAISGKGTAQQILTNRSGGIV